MMYVISCLIILCITKIEAKNTSATFSPSMAKSGWQLVNAAYCSDSVIADWSCSNCKSSGINLTQISTLSYGGSRAFVGYESKDNAIYVSFMGSHNIPQWINNIDTVKTKYPHCTGCKVHTGFYKAYLNIVEDVRSNVKKLKQQHSSASLRVYGHSLGAAVAVHCAADLIIALQFTPEYVYTFGQPRVGDDKFYKWYDSVVKNHFRVTHGHDIVPHLPLQSMGFHHTAREVFYAGNPPNEKICDGSGEDASCSNQYSLDLSIGDHLTYMGGKCCCYGNEDEIHIERTAVQKPIAVNSECDGFTDCSSCINDVVLGAHACSWCPYQQACHDVGSVYNPCPDKSCISLSSVSQCKKTSCP